MAKTGGWLIDGDYSIQDVEAQLSTLLDVLTDDLTVWQDLTQRFEVDVFCGMFLDDSNRGFVLSEALVHMLADRNLMIGFDIYGNVT